MSNFRWQDVARLRRAELVNKVKDEGRALDNDEITALALLSIALELDYLTDNLHRVGEGI